MDSPAIDLKASSSEFLTNKILNPYKGAFYRQYGGAFARMKKSYGILRLYQILIAIDDFLMDKVERAIRGEKVIFNLTPDYIASVKFILEVMENPKNKMPQGTKFFEIHSDIVDDIKKIDMKLKTELNAFFKANKEGANPSISAIHDMWDDLVVQSFYKKTVKQLAEMIQVVCSAIGLPAATEEKYNKVTKLYYLQFSVISKPELVQAVSSQDVADQIEFNRKMVQIQEAKIKKTFTDDGLKVGRLRFGPYMLITGSDASETETIVDPETGKQKVQAKIKKLYCDYFVDEENNPIVFENMKELQEHAVKFNRKYNALRSLVHNPSLEPTYVEETDPVTGRVSKVFQKKFVSADGRELGTFLNTKITYNYIEAKPGIRGQGTKTSEIAHTVSRLDEEAMTHAYGKLTTREITDVDRDNKFTRYSLKRNVETQMIKDSLGRERIVVTSGKYRGFFLDDLVNIEGRMVEGSSYTFNLKGRINKYESLAADGSLKIENLQEPYITLSQDAACNSKDKSERLLFCRLYLGIPYMSGLEANKFKAERDAMVTLAKKMSDVQMIPDTNRQFWTFSLTSYEAVRTALGSCVVSHSASVLIKDYYEDLLRKEYALKKENVKLYGADRIKGFVAKNPFNTEIPMALNNKQMEALAWLDANSFTGLMALDTGVGKTTLATAAILLSKQREGNDVRRFLFVEPKALRGNLKRESIDRFCVSPEEIGARVDEISYEEFLSNFKKGPGEWDFAGGQATYGGYYAIFFDEINLAVKGDRAKAISGFKHPRKILLTGSAIEKDPTDLFKFVALTKGIDITSPAEQNKFVRRYANMIGGRFVGIKPEVKGEFDTWVRTNAYFADKQEVNYVDVGQPQLLKPKTVNKGVVMSNSLKKVYSEVSKKVSENLQAMLKVYKGSIEERATGKDIYESAALKREKLKDFAQGSLGRQIKLLHDLSSNPAKALGRMPAEYLKGLTPKEIEALKKENPKIEAASKIAKEKVISGKKVLFFTDDNMLAVKNAVEMSMNLPNLHVVCLINKIDIYEAGVLARSFSSAAKIQDYLEEIKKRPLGKKAAPVKVNSEEDDDSKRDLEKEEEKTKWAQDVLKKVVLENMPYFSTMTCTKPFARGFNFQPFTSVVHLDRNGWSSEEIKQRTARAYRTGQKEQVDEIFLDLVYASEDSENLEEVTNLVSAGNFGSLSSKWQSLITNKDGTLKPAIVKYKDDYTMLYNYLQGLSLQQKAEGAKHPEVSIDELKGLVQGKDQEFFSSIIKDAMNLKLLESFEAVQKDTSKSIGTSARLLMRAIKPTAEEVAKLQEMQENAEKAPLYYDTPLDDSRFDKVSLKNIKTPLSPSDVLDLSGLGEIYNVANSHTNKTSLTSPQVISSGNDIIVSQPTSDDTLLDKLQVKIKHDGTSPVSVHINQFEIKKCAPPELFASTLLSMVKGAVTSGAKSITVNAKAEEVSPYVKLGFDAPIPQSMLVSLNKPEIMSKYGSKINEILSKLVAQAGGNKADVFKLGLSELFLKETDAKDFRGSDMWNLAPLALTLSLDLNNPKDTKPMMLYFKLKAKESGIDPSEFFTKKVTSPFNTLSGNCWAAFLSGSLDTLISTPKPDVVKTYLKDLKKVVISQPNMADVLLKMVGAVAPKFKKELETLAVKLKSSPDLQERIQYTKDVDTVVSKKASIGASFLTEFDNDPLLNNVWDSLIEEENSKQLESEIAISLGDFLSAEILKP